MRGLASRGALAAIAICCLGWVGSAQAATGTTTSPVPPPQVFSTTAGPAATESPGGPSWVLGFGTPPTEPSGSSATATSTYHYCDLYVSYIKMVYPGNTAYAQALIGDYCNPPTTETYGCGELDEFWLSDSTWHDMSYVCGSVVPADEWSWAYPSAQCRSSATREYRARGYGTEVEPGGTYGAVTVWTYKYLPCVS